MAKFYNFPAGNSAAGGLLIFCRHYFLIRIQQVALALTLDEVRDAGFRQPCGLGGEPPGDKGKDRHYRHDYWCI